MDQEGHAEAMSIEHKNTGKVYRRHMIKGLPQVRLGLLVDKTFELVIEKTLQMIDQSLKLEDRSADIPSL